MTFTKNLFKKSNNRSFLIFTPRFLYMCRFLCFRAPLFIWLLVCLFYILSPGCKRFYIHNLYPSLPIIASIILRECTRPRPILNALLRRRNSILIPSAFQLRAVLKYPTFWSHERLYPAVPVTCSSNRYVRTHVMVPIVGRLKARSKRTAIVRPNQPEPQTGRWGSEICWKKTGGKLA